ncbi:MAG: VOC family protein [Desulfobacteraceae bacterium]|nr:MAG: VOC family protein [Desulfobacteraceae bacterium]
MRFAHTNIAAKDWKRLSRFYIQVFQCREKPPQRNLSGGWLDRATGLTRARLEGIHLWLPGFDALGDHAPTLEIFTYDETMEAPLRMADHQGYTHIAFEVDDVDACLALALEHGASMLGQVVEKTIDGVGLLKFVYFRDPENNIVEIQSWHKD